MASEQEKPIIHLLINSLRGGGAERICVTLANGLTDSGWQVHLVVLNLNNAVFYDLLSENVKVTNLEVNRSLTSFFALYRYIGKTKPDKFLVFNHQLAVLLVILRAVSRFQFKIIARNISNLTAKQKQETSFWHKNIVPFFTKLFYKKAEQVIAQSHAMKEELISNFHMDPSSITVIHNPIAPHIYQEAITPRIKSANDNSPVLLFAGRLTPIKGLIDLLEIIALCKVEMPEIKIFILGDGEQRASLMEKVKEMGLSETVLFKGFVKNVIPFFQQADITLLTSKYEGFPNALVESIALGTPVVSYDCPHGPSEIIIEGENGYLIPQGNTVKFKDAVLNLLNEPLPAEKIMKTATPFYPDTILRKYINCIENA